MIEDGGMEEEGAASDSVLCSYFHTDAINVSSTGIQVLQLHFWGHTHQCTFAHSRRTEKHNLWNWATWGTCQRSWSSGGGWLYYCYNWWPSLTTTRVPLQYSDEIINGVIRLIDQQTGQQTLSSTHTFKRCVRESQSMAVCLCTCRSWKMLCLSA